MRYRLFARAAVVAVAFMGLASCEHASPLEDDTEAVNFAAIQTNIFNRSCALSGCHSGGNAPFGLDLSEGEAYENLVDVRSAEVPDLFRVAPGNPGDSYLVIKVEGGERMAAGTARMPLGRSALSGEQIELIRTWIADGAPNN